MKRKMRNTLVCLFTALTMIIASVVPASAAIKIKNTYALSNNVMQFQLTNTSTEVKANFTFQNMQTKKKKKTSTTSTAMNYKLPKNVWYKTTIGGYDAFGKRVGSLRTVYVCNAPDVKLSLYGTSRIKVTWKKAYGSTGYMVFMSTDNGNTFKKVKTTKGTSYITSSLQKYKNYYFYVIPYKKVGSKKYTSAKPVTASGGHIYTYYR